MAGKVVNMPQSTVMKDRMGQMDIVKLIAGQVLSQLAHPNTEPMREQQHRRRQYKESNVCYRLNWKGHEHLIEFYFFQNDPERGKHQIFGFLFNIDSFHHDPEDYIKGMVENLAKGLIAYQGFKAPKIVGLDGKALS